MLQQTREFMVARQASFTTNLELSLYILCILLILSGKKEMVSQKFGYILAMIKKAKFEKNSNTVLYTNFYII